MFASSYSFKKERLFRLGVDPCASSRTDGQTLLHAACGRGAARVAKLVVRRAVYESRPPRRGFLDARARDGRAARDVARDAGFERIEEWLAALGAASFGVGPTMGPGGIPPGWDRTWDYRTGARGAYAGWDPAAAFPPAYGTSAVGGGGGAPGAPIPHVGAGAGQRGWEPPHRAPPAAPADAYLLGALESVLGDAEEGEDAIVDRDAEFAAGDDRARARSLVRRVAELVEDRDDFRHDLEACEARLERSEAAAAKLRAALRDAARERDAAAAAARAAVAEQRDEERAAVLEALGLAETRAVRMAAERETLREERDAIAEALAFVKDQTRALFSKKDEAERAVGGAPEGAGGRAPRAGGGSAAAGIEPVGGGLHEVAIPTRDAEDAADETAETLQLLEVPLGD